MTSPPVSGKVYMASQLTDAFARKFYYLRLSITDVCNFRCTYCLPDGYKPSGVTNKGFLTVDEIRRVTRAFASLGTEKVRLTGGEPSLRRDLPISSPLCEKTTLSARLLSPPMVTVWNAMWRTGAMLDLLASTSALIVWTPASFTLLPGRTNSTRSWQGSMLHLMPVLRRSSQYSADA